MSSSEMTPYFIISQDDSCKHDITYSFNNVFCLIKFYQALKKHIIQQVKYIIIQLLLSINKYIGLKHPLAPYSNYRV